MSDAHRSSPSADPGPGLSHEQLAERELLQLMSSSPPPPNGLEDDEVDEFALDQDTSSTFLETSPTPAASLRNELVVARRKAAQLKLHPYQRDTLEEFVKVMYYCVQVYV
jgi:hypothetical protein